MSITFPIMNLEGRFSFLSLNFIGIKAVDKIFVEFINFMKKLDKYVNFY
jgi:hypothetical protein